MDAIDVFSLSAGHDKASQLNRGSGLCLGRVPGCPAHCPTLLQPLDPLCGHCCDSSRLLDFLPPSTVLSLLPVVPTLTPVSEVPCFLRIQQSILMVICEEVFFLGLYKHFKFQSTFQLSYNPKSTFTWKHWSQPDAILTEVMLGNTQVLRLLALALVLIYSFL